MKNLFSSLSKVSLYCNSKINNSHESIKEMMLRLAASQIERIDSNPEAKQIVVFNEECHMKPLSSTLEIIHERADKQCSAGDSITSGVPGGTAGDKKEDQTGEQQRNETIF